MKPAQFRTCRDSLAIPRVVAYKLLKGHCGENTQEFDTWLKALRDARAKAKIVSRIDRLADGNPGDVKPVGNGISEMRIHYGPGYRVYYCQRGETIVIILCGGDKDSQAKDIAAAKEIKESLEV